MLIIGLTGSIATGKSTVSSLLSQPPYSLPIIDADLLARKVVEPGTPGYKAIVSYFGPSTPDLLISSPSNDEGSSRNAPSSERGLLGKGEPLNRQVLGRRVFGDSEEKKRDRAVLNGIVHPAVRWEAYKALLYYYLTGHWAVVWDVPLLFEAGVDLFCGTVLVVAVRDPVVQMSRLRARDSHLSEEDAENRVKSQGDVRVKAKRAWQRNGRDGRQDGTRGMVVWNDGGKAELMAKIGNVVWELERTHPKWWSLVLLAVPPLAVSVGFVSIVRNWMATRKWKAEEQEARAKL